MKKHVLNIAVFATAAMVVFNSCKKEEEQTEVTTNKDLIIGQWDKINTYYIDNVEAIDQYAPSNGIYDCGDTIIEYTPLYQVQSIEWEFKSDGTFKNTELGKTFKPTSSACSDGNNPDNYWGDDVVKTFGGTYEISNGGNGDQLILTFGEGYINATILELTESKFDFEYEIEVLQRFVMDKN